MALSIIKGKMPPGRLLAPCALILLALLIGLSLSALLTEEKTEIKTAQIQRIASGKITGRNASTAPSRIQALTEDVTFVSKEIENTLPGANAAVLKWDQTGDVGVDLELRTKNGGTWSSWVEATSFEERKDDTEAPHTALIIGQDITKIQYRFALEAQEAVTEAPPEVNLQDSSIEMMNTTKGPSPTKKNFVKELLSSIGSSGTASARMDGPHIYSRAEWGSPEPESSAWAPEYQPLYRAVVHHTVTPQGSDPSAAIRAIWQYHTYTNGWGDIGYNYLVDSAGNIFQGRYFKPSDAARLKGEVVGGHAYDNNRGTTGIAALGDYSSVRPSDRTVDSIANIIAFKAASYGFNPSGIGPAGPNVIGHREATSTSCPGSQLFARLGEVRTVGDIYYGPRAAMNRYDLTRSDQGFDGVSKVETTMMAGQQTELYFDLKNEGDNTWDNIGEAPVSLGADRPRDRSSVFFTAGSWRAANRTASFSGRVDVSPSGQKTVTAVSRIQPGEVGRFKFKMTAPADASGSYREHFQPIVENREWFARDLALSATINVTPQIYSWRPVGQHIYTDESQITLSDTNVRPGERVYLVLKAENTGNQTWYKDSSHPAINIATSNSRDRTSSFHDSTWIHGARPGTFLEASVAPGQTATFGFWIAMPRESRNFLYYDHYSLVAEGFTWMNTEPGVSWPVRLDN